MLDQMQSVVAEDLRRAELLYRELIAGHRGTLARHRTNLVASYLELARNWIIVSSTIAGQTSSNSSGLAMIRISNRPDEPLGSVLLLRERFAVSSRTSLTIAWGNCESQKMANMESRTIFLIQHRKAEIGSPT